MDSLFVLPPQIPQSMTQRRVGPNNGLNHVFQEGAPH
eukprot:COSAG01_NODE_60348_length_295_cov_0.826531_2_plen_36_part_01